MRKAVALPILSSDALSSVAYGPEAMLAVLALAGSGALGLSLGLSAAIVVLMVAVGLSYRQLIKALPTRWRLLRRRWQEPRRAPRLDRRGRPHGRLRPDRGRIDLLGGCRDHLGRPRPDVRDRPDRARRDRRHVLFLAQSSCSRFTGRIEQGVVNTGDDGRDRRHQKTRRRRSSPASRCSASSSTRTSRRQRRAACSAAQARRDRARTGALQAGHDHAAHEVQGRGLHPHQGRGRPSHAVLRGLPSAVLLPHDGRHRHHQPPEGVEMVMPGDNIRWRSS